MDYKTITIVGILIILFEITQAKSEAQQVTVELIESNFEAIESVAQASVEQSLRDHPDLATFFSKSDRNTMALDLIEVYVQSLF